MHRTVATLSVALLLPLLAAFPEPAPAEVVDSAPGGFTVRSSETVAAPPAEVYAALVGELGRWWNGSHSFSGDAANLGIEARPGGCLLETLPDGGFVCHLEVVQAHPGKLLRLRGGLGPLQGLGVTGALSWELAEGEGGTTVTVTYAVTGYTPGGLEGWAAPVDGVLAEQLGRLGRYLETGSPEAAPEPPPAR